MERVRQAYWVMAPPTLVVACARDSVGNGLLTPGRQRSFCSEVLHHPISKNYPPDPAYIVRVLKAVIAAAEEDVKRMHNEVGVGREGAEGAGHCEEGEDAEVIEELYQELCVAMSQLGQLSDAPLWCYRTYVYCNPPPSAFLPSFHSDSQVSPISTKSEAVPSRNASCAAVKGPALGGREVEAQPSKGNLVAEKLIVTSCDFCGFVRKGGREGGHECGVEVAASASELVTLRLSLNMLQGGTGCYVWPASFHLVSVLLNWPRLVDRKSCLELGSGSGLTGVCLSRLPAGKVILTDGNPETMENLIHNLEINGVVTSSAANGGHSLDRTAGAEAASNRLEIVAAQHRVACLNLDWETASDAFLHSLQADLILGADVVYDPSVIPSLVRVLSALLQRPDDLPANDGVPPGPVFLADEPCLGQSCAEPTSYGGSEMTRPEQLPHEAANEGDSQSFVKDLPTFLACERSGSSVTEGPVALVATAVRNESTLALFEAQARAAGLSIVDVTRPLFPPSCFPSWRRERREDVRLYWMTGMRRQL